MLPFLVDFTTSKCTANGYLYDDTFSICYKPETTLANDTYARQLCQQSGGKLMVIDSPQKQNFIGNITLPTGREYFIRTNTRTIFNYMHHMCCIKIMLML